MKYSYGPYSHSRIDTFFQCPKKFKLNYIDEIKIDFKDSLATEKGSYLHQVLEYNIINKKYPEFEFKLITDLKELYVLRDNILKTKYYQSLKSKFSKATEAYVELSFGLDDNIIPVSYEDTSLFRGHIDLFMKKDDKAIIYDYKSGKLKDKRYQKYDQVEMYVMWAFKKYSDLQEIITGYYYIEHDIVYKKKYIRSDLEPIIKKFMEKLDIIENEKKYNKNVTKLCLWCSFYNEGYCELSDNELIEII